MYLDHTNDDSIARCIRSVARTLRGLRGNLQRQAATLNTYSPSTGQGMSLDTTIREGDDGLDVRLIAGADGECWYATGSVQYDTEYGVACEAVTLSAELDDDALQDMARGLVDGVAEQLACQQEGE